MWPSMLKKLYIDIYLFIHICMLCDLELECTCVDLSNALQHRVIKLYHFSIACRSCRVGSLAMQPRPMFKSTVTQRKYNPCIKIKVQYIIIMKDKILHQLIS